MGATELSSQLWKERALVELLVFKLDELHLLLADDRSRWIPQATKEVEQVLERMRTAGLSRAIRVSAVADEWGCSPDAALRELVVAAPPGVWTDIFDAHLEALTSLADEVTATAGTCQRLLRAALQAPPAHDSAAESGSAMGSGSDIGGTSDVDRSLEEATRDANYRLALAVTARVLQPALADFLR